MGQHSEIDVSALMEALEERWVLTLATTTPDGLPYATPLFCALAALPDVPAPMLVFASRPNSCHGRAIGDGPLTVAAATYLETEDLARLRGVQLRGDVQACTRLRAQDDLALRTAYLARHPIAARRMTPRDQLYVLAITWAKLTDNRRGFGTKLVWTFASPWPPR